VGYNAYHRDQLFNFQLNRWHSLGYTRHEDMVEAGSKIRNFADWKREMLGFAEKAVTENRLMNAAFYFRAAEFYTTPRDPDKEALYDMFSKLFYEAIWGDGVIRDKVLYKGGFLPAMVVSPASAKRGTIVIHGGFDSFIEEWYSMMRHFSGLGYEVVGFEGPGQGAALRKHGLPLELEWEKPVKAVLDHFRLDGVTLLGLSMGGWFALRAAAFEPRIHKVIASGHSMDYMGGINFAVRGLHTWSARHMRGFTDRMAAKKLAKEGMGSWMAEQLMYITKRDKPMDALETYFWMNRENLHPELVRQDCLIMVGMEDHFIPFKMHAMQLKALKNAKSVTGRVFTREEHAQNHCQVGNIGLALNVMSRWIEEKTQ
jgi:pimeloyl-ACP methyl ester carboxylesterase